MNVAEVVGARGLTERAVCRALRRHAARVPAEQAIVELGAYRGRTTGWLALGSSEGHGASVWSVDPWDLRTDLPSYADELEAGYATGTYASSETFADYCAHLVACGAVGPVTPVRGFANVVGLEWTGPPVGLLFHDAEHSVEAVAADLSAWAPHVAPGGLVVLHDACEARLGVVEGARRVLDAPGWDWNGRTILKWSKHPRRRGALFVRRLP